MSHEFRCLVCAAPEALPVFIGCKDYYLGKPQTADYHRCSTCGVLQQFPLPADIGALYEAYPIHSQKSPIYELLRRLVMGRVYYDARGLAARGGVLLDYGCGDGAYLERWRGAGLALVGYENDANHARRLTERLGLPVLSDREELLRDYAGRVQVLTMHFVLEHVTDLDATFADAATLLEPGGTFYYVVPNATSFEARLFGRKWHNLDPPRHISFPARDAARRLASRHGFEVAEERPVAFPNGFAASLAVLLLGRFRFPLFALCLPLGVVFSRLIPSGCRAYRLVRR